MSEVNNAGISDIEKKAMHNIAKVENTPIQVDRKVAGSDMAVMTIIAVIAIICIAVSIVMSFSASPSRELAPRSAQQPLATYAISDYSNLPEGIAAEVNGVEIPESAVTDYIEAYRTAMNLEDEDAWAQFVYEGENYGTTDKMRNYILNIMINEELVVQAAAEVGIEVSDEEIDEVIKKDISDRGYESEDDYWDMVFASGYTEEVFIAQNRNALLQNEIVYFVNPESGYIDTLNDRVLEYIKDSYPAYKDISSLDEVSENIQEYCRKYVIYLLNTSAYNQFMERFIQDSDIKVAAPPEDLSYAVDTGALQLQGFINDFKRKIEVQSQLGGESMDGLAADQDEAIENSEGLEAPKEPEELTNEN